MLIVDTVHEVTSKGESFDRSLTISKALRALAIELGIVVIGVAQFKDGFEEKADERPRKHWLKGGTHMAQDPTDIWLLHRPDLHSSRVELIIDKRRHGEPGQIVNLDFRADVARFEDWRGSR